MSADVRKQAAKDYARETLGNEQFKRNKDAVKSIVTDFSAGWKACEAARQPLPARQAELLQPGDQVRIVGKHPWQGETGQLVSYGPYGLDFLKLEGWLVKLDNGTECYAKASAVAPLPRLKVVR